ncbi:MAG: phosphate ABC transporter substrate-binding protein [Gammaproteobacteria bacterium]|nr:phosphate ABC transporter substrate-binding protein [Gammaproteobacteria bacterium]
MLTKAIFAITALLAGASILAGCGRAPSSSPETEGRTLVLTGSSTVAPLVQEIGQRFEATHPRIRVDVQTGGSSRGIADSRTGTADIGMVSRALKADETDLTAHTIALDGICVIMHATNPIEALSDNQVRSIYRGETTRWSELGGSDSPITVVNKAEGRSTLELFLAYYGLKSDVIQAYIVICDNDKGIKTVSSNPDAIGYVSIGAAEFAVLDGIAIKLLPLGGVAPATENLKNGTYPLSRPLNLVTKGTPDAAAHQLIEFAQSSAVNDLITGLYYVPLQ